MMKKDPWMLEQLDFTSNRSGPILLPYIPDTFLFSIIKQHFHKVCTDFEDNFLLKKVICVKFLLQRKQPSL